MRTLLKIGFTATALGLALMLPLEFSVAPASGEGVIDISRCSADEDNCEWDPSKECASSEGGWVRYYCTAEAVQPGTVCNCDICL